VIAMQRNWIGKSIWAKVWFEVEEGRISPQRTQRDREKRQSNIGDFHYADDQIYGASAIVLAPTILGYAVDFGDRGAGCGGEEIGGDEDVFGEGGGYRYRGEGWIFYWKICGEPV